MSGKEVSCCIGQNCWGCFVGTAALFEKPSSFVHQVREMEDGVLFVWGEYQTTLREPGLYCYNPTGAVLQKVSRQKQSIMLERTKIVDKAGNPLVVNGVVVFCYSDTRKIAVDILNPISFVTNTAQASVKTVVSKYPFEAQKQGQLCLRLNSRQIAREVTRVLGEELEKLGFHVISFQFNELSYAVEIAQAMLKRQQAEALVSSRSLLVSGAVDVTLGAVQELEKYGIGMKPREKTRVITNLLTLLSAEGEGETSNK
eukprot:TRINITY_DN14917_c0_g2_i1.p1 TRINITY_DN14917_c0_g2~~TRINITY_DN14917_c0_g2_i1.p1  ORF type:complete len:257 (+),score=55.08 TRINITY_DN14917_c0_g2_i1:94-864(+)